MSDLDCLKVFVFQLKTCNIQQGADALTGFVASIAPQSRAALFLKRDFEYECVSTSGAVDAGDLLTIPCSELTSLLLAPDQARLRVEECVKDQAFLDIFAASLDGIRTGNILPIRSAQRVEGFALIANAESEERQMIAATALHVFALFIQLRRFEKDVSEDMMAARSVQERTLLRDHPSCPGLDYDVIFRPAKMVSGDYYGVIRHQGSTTGFAVADVSGKGVPAALIMATINTSLHDTMSKSGDGIGALMTRLHNIVFKASPPARYATLVYALYDADRNSLQYVNAGHQPAPILVRGSKIVELEHGGPVLGLMENPIVPFGVGRVSLQPDDVIVIATDGVSDSVNAQGEMWGIESLHLACIEACGHRLKSARSIADKIMKEALRFCNDYPVQDDMTLMVLRVLK